MTLRRTTDAEHATISAFIGHHCQGPQAFRAFYLGLAVALCEDSGIPMDPHFYDFIQTIKCPATTKESLGLCRAVEALVKIGTLTAKGAVGP